MIKIFSSNIRNQTIFSDNDKIRFFFFGCWNKNNDATNDIISKVNAEGIYTFGVACGDNVYPEKIDGVKIAKIEDIEIGFNILKKFQGNVYIGLGNHEVDSTEPCDALLKQKNNATENIIMPNNYYSINIYRTVDKNLLSKIILIDTNLLEVNICYENINENLENEMIEWLKNELSLCENTQPIVMGHYPLFYYKKNKNTLKFEFQFNPTMDKIYKILLNYNKPIYYLCADIHNYQHIITSNIIQHIVGTGGADQDEVFESNLLFSPNDNQPVVNIVKCVQKYGYLDVDIENNLVTGEFKESDVPVIIKLKNKNI